MELGVEAIGKDEISPGGEQLGATPAQEPGKRGFGRKTVGPFWVQVGVGGLGGLNPGVLWRKGCGGIQNSS